MSHNHAAVDPIGMFLAISGTKGERLVFRYPLETTHIRKTRGANPYALVAPDDEHSTLEDRGRKKSYRSSSVVLDELGVSSGAIKLRSFADKTLANMFAYNIKNLYNQKFEVKVDDVIFVGHPHVVATAPQQKVTGGAFNRLNLDTPQRTLNTSGSSLTMFHIVFALEAEHASDCLIASFHQLSLQLAVAVFHEEERCAYLSAHIKEITSILDKVHETDPPKSPFMAVLEQNTFAQSLRDVFDDLIRDGRTQVRINDWIQVSYCLLPKIHRNFALSDTLLIEQIQKMRPYHGLLLFETEQQIINELPIDSSSLLVRIIRIVNPLHNFQQLAMEAGATLSEVFTVAGHLIYWAKARLIFPVCETNVYALAVDAQIRVISETSDEFSDKFPELNLLEMLADFSMPQPIRDLIHPFSDTLDAAKLTQIVIWCLKQNLLVQLHTYIYLIPSDVQDVSYLNNETLNWINLPPQVRAKVDEMASTPDEKESGEHSTFTKLVPYFRGNAHLEEIMFDVNIKRSDLMTILDKYRDVLVTCVHEDKNLPIFDKILT